MSMEQGRTERFQRNADLEALLGELNELLGHAAAADLERTAPVDWPVVLVIGAPRSGTTLALQWLAATGALAAPTNLLARFYQAPSIGARLQRLLTDPALGQGSELGDLAGALRADAFESELGKTRGALAPHEFWYFWRRFLPTVDIEPMGARAADADWTGLRRELGLWAAVEGRPLALKGMMLQYDLPALAECFPEALFVHLERDPVSNALSLLRARERFFGTRERWYSAKPPEFEALQQASPAEQVAGQVHWTVEHVRAGLAALGPARSVTCRYEDFCADTGPFWRSLRERAAALGYSLPERHAAPASFEARDRGEREAALEREVERALADLGPLQRSTS